MDLPSISNKPDNTTTPVTTPPRGSSFKQAPSGSGEMQRASRRPPLPRIEVRVRNMGDLFKQARAKQAQAAAPQSSDTNAGSSSSAAASSSSSSAQPAKPVISAAQKARTGHQERTKARTAKSDRIEEIKEETKKLEKAQAKLEINMKRRVDDLEYYKHSTLGENSPQAIEAKASFFDLKQGFDDNKIELSRLKRELDDLEKPEDDIYNTILDLGELDLTKSPS